MKKHVLWYAPLAALLFLIYSVLDMRAAFRRMDRVAGRLQELELLSSEQTLRYRPAPADPRRDPARVWPSASLSEEPDLPMAGGARLRQVKLEFSSLTMSEWVEGMNQWHTEEEGWRLFGVDLTGLDPEGTRLRGSITLGRVEGDQ